MNTTNLYTTNDAGHTEVLGQFNMRPQDAIETFKSMFWDHWRHLMSKGHNDTTIWWD